MFDVSWPTRFCWIINQSINQSINQLYVGSAFYLETVYITSHAELPIEINVMGKRIPVQTGCPLLPKICSGSTNGSRVKPALHYSRSYGPYIRTGAKKVPVWTGRLDGPFSRNELFQKSVNFFTYLSILRYIASQSLKLSTSIWNMGWYHLTSDLLQHYLAKMNVSERLTEGWWRLS